MEIDPWTSRIQDVVGNRVGNILARAGIHTLDELRDKIIKYGIRGEEDHFFFGGRELKYIPRAGRKTRATMLEALSNNGFRWQDYLTSRYEERSIFELRDEIHSNVQKLIELLKEYLALEKGV